MDWRRPWRRKSTAGGSLGEEPPLVSLLNDRQVVFTYDRMLKGNDLPRSSSTTHAPDQEIVARLDEALSDAVGEHARIFQPLGLNSTENPSREITGVGGNTFTEGTYQFSVMSRFGMVTVNERLFGDLDLGSKTWSRVVSVERELILTAKDGSQLRINLPGVQSEDGIKMPLLLGDPSMQFPLRPWAKLVFRDRLEQRRLLVGAQFSPSATLRIDQQLPDLPRAFNIQRDLPDANSFLTHMSNATRGDDPRSCRDIDFSTDQSPQLDLDAVYGALADTGCAVGFPLVPDNTALYVVPSRDWKESQELVSGLSKLGLLGLYAATYDGDCAAAKVVTKAGTIVVTFDSTRFSPTQAIAVSETLDYDNASELPIGYRQKLRVPPEDSFVPYQQYMGTFPDRVHAFGSSDDVAAGELLAASILATVEPTARNKPAPYVDVRSVVEALGNVGGVFLTDDLDLGSRRKTLEFVADESSSNCQRLVEGLQSLRPVGVSLPRRGHDPVLVRTRAGDIIVRVGSVDIDRIKAGSEIVFADRLPYSINKTFPRSTAVFKPAERPTISDSGTELASGSFRFALSLSSALSRFADFGCPVIVESFNTNKIGAKWMTVALDVSKQGSAVVSRGWTPSDGRISAAAWFQAARPPAGGSLVSVERIRLYERGDQMPDGLESVQRNGVKFAATPKTLALMEPSLQKDILAAAELDLLQQAAVPPLILS